MHFSSHVKHQYVLPPGMSRYGEKVITESPQAELRMLMVGGLPKTRFCAAKKEDAELLSNYRVFDRNGRHITPVYAIDLKEGWIEVFIPRDSKRGKFSDGVGNSTVRVRRINGKFHLVEWTKLHREVYDGEIGIKRLKVKSPDLTKTKPVMTDYTKYSKKTKQPFYDPNLLVADKGKTNIKQVIAVSTPPLTVASIPFSYTATTMGSSTTKWDMYSTTLSSGIISPMGTITNLTSV